MLELKNVNISIKNSRNLVSDFNLSVNSNDKIAIIGEEGNGKSTLLKYIYDTNLISSYCIYSGSVIKNNLRLGYLEQFLDPKWDNILVSDFLLKKYPDQNIDYSDYNKLNDVYKYLSKLNIESDILDEDLFVKNLSGGQKVKLQILKLLILNPDVMLLDEPTNDIDLQTLEWLEHFIISLKIPVIYVSHDEMLLANTANVIVHLEELENKTKAKHTIESIGYQEYIKKRLYNISRQEQISKNEHYQYQKQLQKYNQIYQKVDSALNTVSRQDPSKGRLLKKKMKSVKSIGKRLDQKELIQRPYVEESIIVKFHNDNIYANKVILDFKLSQLKIKDKLLSKNISLLIKGSDKLVIIGKNGIGKSTLLKEIYNKLLENNKNGAYKIGYMPQNYEDEFKKYQYVLDYIRKDYSKEEETLARTYLGSMKFTEEEMTGKIQNLSGGQKAKLFLLRLILDKCNILILDEPTRNLSPLSNPSFRNALKNYSGCIISVSHDRKYINEVCNKVYELDQNGLFFRNL